MENQQIQNNNKPMQIADGNNNEIAELKAILIKLKAENKILEEKKQKLIKKNKKKLKKGKRVRSGYNLFMKDNIAVLPVNDTRNISTDKSGAILVKKIKEQNHKLVDRKIVKDN